MTANWAGTHTYRAPQHLKVTTEQQVSEAIRTHTGRVHALGTRHSFTDLPDTDGLLIDMSGMEHPARIDPDTRTVRVSAGTRYGVLARQLHAAGWAVHNLGSLPHISVGGATSTGTHGSGNHHGVLSTAIRAVRFVDGTGDVREIRHGDPDFAAVALGVGAFGIITELELAIEPTYNVRQDVYENVSWQALTDDVAAVTSAGDSVSIFTLWRDVDLLWVKRRTPVSVADTLLDGHLSSNGVARLGLGPSVTELGADGPWFERLPHFRADQEPSRGDENQSEYFIDHAHAADAINAVRALEPVFAEHLIWSELRTAAADELWLSGAYQRNSFIVHFTWENRPTEVRAALTHIEAALAPFHARPHWGKLHLFDRERLEQVAPRLADARAVYERLDPEGRFVNDHLVRVGVREAR